MARPASGTVAWKGNPARWFARVSVRDEQGVTRRPWVDLERPDLRNTPDDKKTAKACARRLAKKKLTYVGKERATAPSTTVADLESKWYALLDVDPRLADGTRATYKSCFRSNITAAFGTSRVADLTVPVLRQWIRDLAAELAPSTVNNNAIAFTRFLGDARAEGWVQLESNPMRHEDVRAMMPSVEAPDPEDIVFWAKEQIETLLALPALPHERFGHYLVAFLSGLRAGELRGLTFAHFVDVENVSCLSVRQQLRLARRAGEKQTIGKPKSRSGKRNVPLHPLALAWLTWWRDEGWAARYGRERTDGDPIFPAVDGKAGRPRDANIVRRDLEAAGLPLVFTTPDGERVPFTFHAARRSLAHMLDDAGASAEVIENLLGHKRKGVTATNYTGRSLEAMARAVNLLSLKLPARAGVIQSSRELSLPVSASNVVMLKPAGNPSKTHEQPIELPQFRHSIDEVQHANAISENHANRVAMVASSGQTQRNSNRLVLRGRTKWDETKSGPVEAALVRALERATDDATIANIVAELAKRRTRR